jgi:hypothetical protein
VTTSAYDDENLIPATDDMIPDDGETGLPTADVRQLRAVDDYGLGSYGNYELDAEAKPRGPLAHQVWNSVESQRWLLTELGAHNLSGMFLRGDAVVYTCHVGEDGYIPPPPSPEGTPEHKRNSNGPATVRPVTAKGVQAKMAAGPYAGGYLVWQTTENPKNPRKEVFFPASSAGVALEAIQQERYRAPNLRELHGITHTPMVRADGTILDEPGYDDATGFLYLPTIDVPRVPERPTDEQLAAATTLLRGLVAEFTWVGKNDEANLMGAFVTPLLRLVCPPPYKLVAIMARQPGSGKSLLNRILREVHGGVFRSEMPHDDAELEKSISSILSCTTAPVIQFDNVSGILRSSRLD